MPAKLCNVGVVLYENDILLLDSRENSENMDMYFFSMATLLLCQTDSSTNVTSVTVIKIFVSFDPFVTFIRMLKQ